MKYPTSLLLGIGLCMVLSVGCAPQAQPDTSATVSDTLPAKVNWEVSNPDVQGSAPDDTEFETLANGEMVMYCLPYPKGEFEEDYDRSEYRGHHVLVSRDKQSTITFAGNPLDMTWAALQAKCVADVQAQSGSHIITQALGIQDIVLMWDVGNRRNYLKKWYRQEGNETVTVHLEYPLAAASTFKPWIVTIAGSSSWCEF